MTNVLIPLARMFQSDPKPFLERLDDDALTKPERFRFLPGCL